MARSDRSFRSGSRFSFFRLLGWVLAGALLGAALLPVRWAYWARLDDVAPFRERVAPARDAFYRLEGPVRRLFGGYAVPDTLPVLRLTLGPNENRLWMARLDTIRARGVNVGAGKEWVRADISIGTEAREGPPATAAEVTWHGKFRRHWGGRQRSFKVKLGGGSKWWGLSSFALLTPDNRDGPGLLLAAQLARAAGVWHPRVRVVRVEINDDDCGMYYAEELIDEEFLARRGLKGGAVLTPRATWADDFADHRRDVPYGQGVGFNRAAHVNALALEPAFQEVETASDSVAATALAQWARLRDLVTADSASADSSTVAAAFDVAAWGAADALRHLLADRHNLANDNLHVAYDPRTGRFQPIYRFEGGLARAERQRGLTNGPTLSYNGAPLPLWRFVNSNPTLRLAKLRALHRLTATTAPVEEALQAAAPATELLTHAPGSQLPVRWRTWQATELAAVLRHNRALIHQSLTQDLWLYGTATLRGGYLLLDLLPEGEGAVKLGEAYVMAASDDGSTRLPLSATLVADVAHVGGSPETVELAPRRVQVRVPWNGGRATVGSTPIRARNFLTGELLDPKRVRVQVVRVRVVR